MDRREQRYMIEQNIDERVDRLVDRRAYSDEPTYHAMVSMLRSWLLKTGMAMEDEGVDPEVIIRVLDRLTYITPDGFDAHRRMARRKEDLERLIVGPRLGPIL